MPFSNNNKKDDMRGSIGNTRKTIKLLILYSNNY